jgi:hypothetical protein
MPDHAAAIDRLAVKLGSLVIHAQELNVYGSLGALEADATAIRGLANDPDVTAWLETIDPALLPRKR